MSRAALLALLFTALPASAQGAMQGSPEGAAVAGFVAPADSGRDSLSGAKSGSGISLGTDFGTGSETGSGAGSARHLTLEECIRLARENNYGMENTRLSGESAQADYEYARGSWLPEVNASAGESFNHSNPAGGKFSGSYGINASMMLYQGGAIREGIERSRLQAEQAGAAVSQYDNQLTIQVLQAFLSVIGNEELMKYQQELLTASRAQRRQGEARYSAGQILRSDYLILEAQEKRSENDLFSTSVNRQNSLNALKTLLAIGLEEEIEVVHPEDSHLMALGLLPGLEEVLEMAKESLPDLKISEYNVRLAESGLKISQAGYLPTLSLSGGIGTSRNDGFGDFFQQVSDNFSQRASLSLSIPIFTRGQTRNNVTKSKIALSQARLKQQQAESEIEKEVVTQYNDVLLARSACEASGQYKDAYEASFKASQAQFAQGSITAVELLQQQNNFISALNSYIQDKYSYLLKRKILDVYMGETVKL